MTVGTNEYYDTHIDCAAIRMPNGRVWTGKRHSHCIATIKQATGEPAHAGEQGFVTMSGKFVTREEGAALVLQTHQAILNHPPLLYSEDLY